MAEEELVRFGILGCGSIALFRHALELSQNPAAEICMVYDPIRSRAEYLVSRFGLETCKIAESEEELISNACLDAIVVATPNSEVTFLRRRS